VLGRIIAHLHRDGPVNAIAECTAPQAHVKASNALNKVPKTDRVFAWMDERLSEFVPDTDWSFVHGNLRRENILFHDDQIGLIDFETCGVGSRYEDLSMISANMALSRAATVFPWARVYEAWAALIAGYEQVWSFDQRLFEDYLMLQLMTNYAWLLAGKKVTIAKVPVSRRRMQSIMMTLSEDGFRAGLTGIRF